MFIFYNIYSSDFRTAFDLKTILFAVGGVTISFLVLWLIVPHFVRENTRRGVMIQGMFRSNFALLGLPIVENLSGRSGAQMAAVAVAFIIPLLNTLSTIVLARFSFNGKPSIWQITKKVLLNPLIIASASGILMVFVNVRPPLAADRAIANLGGLATPLALLALGAGFRFGGIKKNIVYLTMGSLAKNVLVPLVFLSCAAALGFKGVSFAVLIAIFASPVAVSSFIMAVRENADGELAGQLVVVTTFVSLLTIFLFIYFSRLLGLV